MNEDLVGGREGVGALTNGCGVVRLSRDVISAVGPDTMKFLQSQLSQDVSTLETSESRWSFLLQPTGKLVGLFRVTRISLEECRLDADPGMGEGVENALRRFLIRTKCALTLQRDAVVHAVRGEGATAPGAIDAADQVRCFPSMQGVDIFDPSFTPPAGMTRVEPDCYDYLRIASGVPMWSRELIESTIPNATGLLPVAVSFTKGCYVGQELVERIDSRGAETPKSLRRLTFESSNGSPDESLLLAGAEVFVAEDTTGPKGSKGLLTSVAVIEGLPPVALAYLHRDVEVGSAVRVGPVGPATLSATVRALEIG